MQEGVLTFLEGKNPFFQKGLKYWSSLNMEFFVTVGEERSDHL